MPGRIGLTLTFSEFPIPAELANPAVIDSTEERSLTRIPGAGPILRQFMPELDLVRAIAILAVVLYHGFLLTELDPLSPKWSQIYSQLTRLEALVVNIMQFGWLGVDLFFVLSGFLITGILLDSKQACTGRFFRSFYARRALRILPAYYLVLLVVAFVLYLHQEISPEFFWLSFFYLSNVSLILGFGASFPLTHLWSLAVEEHFYFIWPALIRSCSTRWFATVVIAMCVSQPLARALCFLYGDADSLYVATWFRLDGFAWGAILSLLVRTTWLTRGGLLAISALAMGAGVGVIAIGWTHGIATKTQLAGAALQFAIFGMIFMGFLGITLFVGTGRYAKILLFKPVLQIGKISYCLYLIHQFCYWVFDRVLLSIGTGPEIFLADSFACMCVRALLVLLVAIGLSLLSYRYFEKPFLNLKSKF